MQVRKQQLELDMEQLTCSKYDQTCVSYISCIGRRVLYRLCYLGSPFSTVRTQHMTELNFLKILGKVLMAQAEQYLEDTRDEDEVVKTA